jgi:hypothetical protein
MDEIGNVLIKCPATSKDVPTGFTMSQDDWDLVSIKADVFKCEECGELHTWTKQDARLVSPSKRN